MRLPMIAALMTALAAPALAQDWTAGTEADWSGAVACTADESACLSVGCVKGGVLTWEMWFPDGMLAGVAVPDAFDAGVAVDGTGQGALDFAFDDLAGLWIAPVTGADEAALLSALQAGQDAAIAIDGVSDRPLGIGLAGSRAAIDTALAACPARAPVVAEVPPAPEPSAPEPPPVKPTSVPFPTPFPNEIVPGTRSDNPAADALANVRRDCGAEPVIGPGFVTLRDLNADGINDAIISYGAAGCGDGGSFYCGTGGCTQEIWLATPEGPFTPLFSGLVQTITPAGPGLIDFGFHGGACGLAGAERCDAHMRIENGVLVRAD